MFDNEWILISTINITTAGNHTVNFRAKEIGAVFPLSNTITNPVNIVLGVTRINNPSPPQIIGESEETDAQLRTRRNASLSLSSSGNIDSLLGTIKNLNGVNDAVIYENLSNVIDSNKQPPHNIWVIVNGGSNKYIALAIYEKKSMGCDMFGSVTENVVRPDGSSYQVKFGRPVETTLYIKFELIPRRADSTSIDQDKVKTELSNILKYGIGKPAYISDIATKLESIVSSHIPVDLQISLDQSTWHGSIASPTVDTQFQVTPSDITILS